MSSATTTRVKRLRMATLLGFEANAGFVPFQPATRSDEWPRRRCSSIERPIWCEVLPDLLHYAGVDHAGVTFLRLLL